MTENIKYQSQNIEAFYKNHRIRWADFYESERKVFEMLELNENTSVLDIGCGCAGLGLALKERFGVQNYTGVEINEQAAHTGKILYPESTILANDIMEKSDLLPENGFDLVVSLGAIDWNIRFEEMLFRAFELVKPNGYFLCSYRLTTQPTQNDLNTSYQFVDFEGKQEGEKAPYIVSNAKELVNMLKKTHPSEIKGYGYWGKPSATAVTPYDQVCFAVIALQKTVEKTEKVIIDLQLPEEILQHIKMLFYDK